MIGESRGKRVLVLGDSITNFGDYISVLDFYFTRYLKEQKPEFINLGVSSENVSGLSEAEHPFPRPCILSRAKRALETIKPDVVITCYGMNDGIYQPFSDENFKAYQEGYHRLIEEIRACGAKLVIMTPPVFDKESFEEELYEHVPVEMYSYMHPYAGYDEVLKRYGEYVMTELAEAADLTIDIYHPMKEYITQERGKNSGYLSGDGIHPSLGAHTVIARTILERLYNRHLPKLEHWVETEQELFELIHSKRTAEHNKITEEIGHDNPCKLEVYEPLEYAEKIAEYERAISEYLTHNPVPKTIHESWNGFAKETFMFEGYEAIKVEPEHRRRDGEWIWKTEFFDAFPYVELEMVRKGFCLVNLNLTDQFGASSAIAEMKKFGVYLTEKCGLNTKCVLAGFSRGGLYAVNYALACPEKTAVLYLDAPVVDIRSWPAGYGTGCGSSSDWNMCREAYTLDGYPEECLKQWLTERALSLEKSNIPLVIVAGDSDEVVPYEENGGILSAAYRENGGDLLEILKPGVGHHPHSLKEPQPVVDFIINHLQPNLESL